MVIKKTTKKNVKKSTSKKTAKKVVKKTAKKVVNANVGVKKKVTKKATKKTPQVSVNKTKASGEQCFYVTDGLVINDLLSLANAFDTMSNDVFCHHVNDERNDFANWTKEIMKEAKLAEKIMSQNTPDRCQIIILRHLLK